ncbi:helix-turn-helix transcriptional regulator [Mycoplasmatota bacterium]|nr:helix-turn-helix transcriptional regulator [Mycoplasmatota bacterium]
MNAKLIGKAVLKVRKERGLSQTDMASDLGVSRQAVSNWERGKTYPDVETLNQIAVLYDVSIDTLMDGKVQSFDRRERSAKFINMLLFILIVLGSVYLFLYTDASRVFVILYLLCSVPVYLIFQLILKTESYSFMAGFDSKVEYDVSNLRKFILELQLSILLITTLQLILELCLSLFALRKDHTNMILIFIYFLGYITFILVVNFRNKDKVKKTE